MFNKKLRKLRTDNELSQKTLASILGVSPSTVAMYEQGRRTPDNEMLKKIADYFNVSIDFLLGADFKTRINSSIVEKKVIEILDAISNKGLDPNNMDLKEFDRILEMYMLAKGIKKD
ncbi:helix-turn-helix transcriptional regulator [Clostridium botulinum]|uniref:Helix-turn-helix transcriptional regulator n=1 Tax=Clostridium botulinum TaxID=1491 RepID=A0A846JR17_CLOBO|nr:helix-turn-helix transcriptional regulator [Clostridium botulinum]KAI3344131.1 helix-turn-helix domain-containing protein [Clostridium botulinum]KOM89545.1 hypothetical protein ACP51_02300 [Clostridium botulinum]KOR61213.1 hypothetical protein ADT22_08015 [Clostridium botulinum]NFE13329.1 helix-turn-helix transcriptional regulator [Clostridium botulinum]NFE82843.1 helix-turn-helix transcriptional regulator [Clostridium botulinum]